MQILAARLSQIILVGPAGVFCVRECTRICLTYWRVGERERERGYVYARVYACAPVFMYIAIHVRNVYISPQQVQAVSRATIIAFHRARLVDGTRCNEHGHATN